MMAARKLRLQTVSIVIGVQGRTALGDDTGWTSTQTVDVRLYAVDQRDAEARLECRLQRLLGDDDEGFEKSEPTGSV